MDVGRLRDAMARKGWSYRELARRAGLRAGHVWRVLHGYHPHVSVRTLQRICRALDVPVGEVFAGRDGADRIRQRRIG